MGLLPGTVARGRAAWERLRARQTSDDRMREVLETPMLLRPEVLDIVVDRHEPDQVTLAGEVNSLAQDLRSQPFPLGLGPVEALWRSLHDGTLSEPEACVQARSLPVTENLVGPYVAELFAVLIAPATRPQTWRLARAQGRALVAALDACPDRPELALPGRLGQLEWTAALLTTVPDGALLAGADQLGRAMLENLPPEDLRTRGTIHRALAVLWGDPYVAGRSSAHAEQQDQTWRQRGAAEHAVDNRPWDDWRMPEAVDALTSSVEHWRVACSARPQDPRTIIGLVEAGLALAQRVDGDPPADVIEAARTGLGLEAEETTRARFSQAARILGLAATADVATFEMDRCDTDTLIARSGADVALSVLQRISGLEIDDPGQALRLALEHSELLAEPGALPPESFVIFVQLLVRLLNAAHGVPEATSGPEGSTSFLDHAHAVLDRVDSQSDRCAESLVATALQLAVQSSFVNAEADGLVLLESAVKIAPLFARRYAWVIDALRAVLMTGEAVNQHVAGNDSSAVRWYLLSMESWGRQ
ncbi:MAG: hypothetical protein WAR57_08160, partial [Candidatus Phosphoribacter sp.]